MTILTDAELGEIRERLERAGDDTASWAYDRDVRALLAHIDAVKAESLSAPAVEESGWFLPAARINDIQRDSVTEQIRLCKAAHYTNLRIRINGEWQELQADWVKHLQPFTPTAKES